MSIVQYKPTITRKDLEIVLDCLINDELTGGEPVKHFESSLSELIGIKYCTAVSSLTAAYHLAFKALDIGPGSEVIIPSFFSVAPLAAANLTGATPVLVDLAENSLTTSPELVKEKITDKTKAIILAHTFGINTFVETFTQFNIPIIEDISHALGAEFEDKPVGNQGSITIASFNTIDMITTGNGAALWTRNTRHFATMRDFRSGDKVVTYDYTATDLQGAMGVTQISRLQDFIRRRREIAQVYYDRIRVTPHKTLFPFTPNCVYHSFPIIFDASSDKVDRYWKNAGIQTMRPISKPLHAYLDLKPMDFPQSDRLSKKLYSLPIYPSLTRKEIDKISRSLAKFV